MFTGIIEEIGVVKSINRKNKSAVIEIAAKIILEDIKTGDSINTNGACLTVTEFNKNSFSVDVVEETMRRTNFRDLIPGSKLNLERALKISDRLSGHIVSGHIDGTGKISNKIKEGLATLITIGTNPDILKYIIPKGSVAIDGISLTIAEITTNSFEVAIIPHTSLVTSLLQKKKGEEVNLECDIVGKYIEKLVRNDKIGKQKTEIDLDFLKTHGF